MNESEEVVPVRKYFTNKKQLREHKFPIKLIENTEANVFISCIPTHNQSVANHRDIWLT